MDLNSKNRSEERTSGAAETAAAITVCDGSGSDRGGGADFMDLAAMHQHNSSLGREIYPEKKKNLRAVARDSLTLQHAGLSAAIKRASRRMAAAPPGWRPAIHPSLRRGPANWSVYNTFNYPVRSFAVGKLTPGTRRATDDTPPPPLHPPPLHTLSRRGR